MTSKSLSSKISLATRELEKLSKADLVLMGTKMDIESAGMLPKDALCKILATKIVYIYSDKLPTDNERCERYTHKFTEAQLKKIRGKVYTHFKKYANSVTEMSPDGIKEIVLLYDSLCFDGDIHKYIVDNNFTLDFKTDGEYTFTTEGLCSHKSCSYVITIPLHYFESVKPGTNVAGHLCNDQLECLQRVIEHELVHLIIFIFCNDPYVTDQHGALFMNTVSDLFGHTDHRHYMSSGL